MGKCYLWQVWEAKPKGLMRSPGVLGISWSLSRALFTHSFCFSYSRFKIIWLYRQYKTSLAAWLHQSLVKVLALEHLAYFVPHCILEAQLCMDWWSYWRVWTDTGHKWKHYFRKLFVWWFWSKADGFGCWDIEYIMNLIK